MTEAQEEPLSALLAGAAAEGAPVTRSQLRRYQQEGLLPAPRQRGLGRGRGTEVLYPAGSTGQLILLRRVLRANRSFRRARWSVWWAGYRVPRIKVRRALGMVGKHFDLIRAKLLRDGGLTDAAEVQLESLASARLPTGPLARARRRVGTENFPAFLEYVLRLILGGDVDHLLDPENRRVFEQGLGIARAVPEAPSRLHAQQGEHLRELMHRMGGRLSSVAIGEALTAATDAEIEAARDELRGLLEGMPALVSILGAFVETAGKKDPPALRETRVLASAASDTALGPDEQLGLLAIWLSLRRDPEIVQWYLQAMALVAPILALAYYSGESVRNVLAVAAEL